MLAVPKIDTPEMVFGSIKHMPKYKDLPEEFQDWHYHPFCRAASHWFMKGGEPLKNGMVINGDRFTAKEGVDAADALRAIKTIMSSWEPKHEHKIAACGFLLHEWFNKETAR